jgi:hypothetical protein
MANTTNYNWETPDDTDLVKDGAAAIRTLGSSVDTTTKALNPSTTLGDIEYRSSTANTNTRLGIGTTGQVLSVVGGVPAWATSDDANAIQNAIVDAKGDIVAASAADTPARLAVGTDNQRLIAASGEATGLKYVSDTQNTVIDAAGDLLYGTAADTVGRLAVGSTGNVLTVAGGVPTWAAPAGGGKVLQVVQVLKTDTFTSSNTSFTDITGLSVSITPSSASSKVLVLIHLTQCGPSGTGITVARLVRDATVVYAGDASGSRSQAFFSNILGDTNDTGQSPGVYLDSPATTSSTTYKIQGLVSAGTFYVNRSQNDANASYALRGVSSITLMEIGA